MNSKEFAEWINYHATVFDDFGKWMSNLTDEARDTISATWQRQMLKIDVDAAKLATDVMVAGDIKKPFHASDTLSTIIPEARRQRTFRLKSIPALRREERFACLTCRDSGYAVCWHPVAMQAVVENRLGEPFTLTKTAVCCCCGLGRHYSEHSVKRDGDRPWTIYNPARWLLIDRLEDGKQVIGQVTDAAEQERLRDFMGDFHERNINSKQWDPDRAF